MVGTATLNLIVGTAGEKAWLEDFVTSSEESVRGKGMGYAIWGELLNWCREREVNLSFTSNPDREAARRFYERQGAEIIATTVFRVPVEK